MIRFSDLLQLKNGIIVLAFMDVERTLSCTSLSTKKKKNKKIKTK